MVPILCLVTEVENSWKQTNLRALKAINYFVTEGFQFPRLWKSEGFRIPRLHERQVINSSNFLQRAVPKIFT